MKSLFSIRSFALGVTLLIALGACSSDADISDTATEDGDVAAAAIAQEPAVEQAPLPDIPGIDAPTTTILDDRTLEEQALDRLDLTMFQLGVPGEDLIQTSDCVINRLAAEGVELDGEAAADIVALIGCRPEVTTVLFPQPDPTINPDTWACVTRGIGEEIAQLSIAEGEAFLAAPAPPPGLIETLSANCGISVDELNLLFN